MPANPDNNSLEVVEKDKSLGGRPTKFQNTFIRRAYRLTLLGLNDKQLAEALEISEATLHGWKQEYPQFLESIRKGKADTDAKVAESLLKRALGYDRKEKVKSYETEDGKTVTIQKQVHIPADVNAASLWLRNRQPARWRDKTEVDNNVTVVQPILGGVAKSVMNSPEVIEAETTDD